MGLSHPSEMIAGLIPPTPEKVVEFVTTLLTVVNEFVLAIVKLAVYFSHAIPS